MVSPASATICASGPAQLLTASGGSISGTTSLSSGTISLAIPDVNTTGINNTLAVSGIPGGSTIDSVIVTYSITHGFDSDIIIDLEAPNGQIINLVKGTIITTGANFTNTRISSDETKPAIPTSGAPFTSTYRADKATTGFQLAPTPLPTTSTWNSLFSTPNGNWKIRVYDDESVGTGTLTNWQIKVSYSAASTFTWTPNGAGNGLYTDMNASLLYSGAASPTVFALPNGTTTYTATATSSSGCTNSGTSVITINPSLPVSLSIASSDMDNTICAGTSVTFTATPTNGGASPSYQWKLNGGNVGTDSPMYATSTLANGDSVWVVLTSNATCATGNPATSTKITTTVNPNLPVSVSISSSDMDNTICAGTSVTFTATPTNGGGSPSYQWKLNGGNVGTNSPMFVTSTLANADSVWVVLTSNALCATGNPATSSKITTTVNPNLPVSVSIMSSDGDNTICAGTSVTFTATPTNGGASPSYQWKLNGGNVGTNSPMFMTSALANADSVWVILTSNAMCTTGNPATSNKITTTVNPNLPVSVSISSSDMDNTICAGTAVTFTATPTNGGGSPSYQWKLNGGNVGSNSPMFMTSSLANADSVWVILTSNVTCPSGNPATSNKITTTVNPNLPVSVSIASSDMDNSICIGTSVTFTATPTNGGASPSYQWKLNGGNVGSNSPMFVTSTLSNADSVWVVLTSNALCATGNPATSSKITTTVNPNLLVSVSITSSDVDNTICTGESVTFTATPTNGGGGPMYQWKLNGGDVGMNSNMYTTTTLANGDMVSVVLTSNSGAACLIGNPATSNTISTTVTPPGPVSVSISSSDIDNIICAGTIVTFTATPVNGGGSPSYQWKHNGMNAGTNSPMFVISNLANGDSVRVVLTSNSSCATGNPASSNTIFTTVNPNIPVSVSITSDDGDNNICAGTSVTFTATPVNGGGGPFYQWKRNGGNVGTNSPTYMTSTLANADSVWVVLTSNVTCATGNPASSNKITTTVNPNLPVSVSISSSDGDNIICDGTSVTFTASPTNGGGSPTYQWKHNGMNAGTNSPMFNINTLMNGDSVRVVLTSNAICATGSPATSAKIITTVNPNLAVSVSITSNDMDNSICAGTSVTFTAFPVNGGGAPTYQWKRNNSNVGTNSNMFTTSTLASTDTIRVMLTSNATCPTGSPATSNYIVTTVNPFLPVSVSISSSDMDNTICLGDLVTFTANPVNGGGGPSYQWKHNGVNAGTDSPMFAINTLANGDSVRVVLTSNAVCATGSPKSSNAIITTVNPIVNPGTISGVTEMCIGGSYFTTNGNPGGTWASSDNMVATVDNTGFVTSYINGTFDLTYTITTGCGSPSSSAPHTVTVTTGACACTPPYYTFIGPGDDATVATNWLNNCIPSTMDTGAIITVMPGETMKGSGFAGKIINKGTVSPGN